MTDIDLLILGCAVTFIAIGGAYTFLRERYLEAERPLRNRVSEIRAARRNTRRAA